jgi:hypothetical protein
MRPGQSRSIARSKLIDSGFVKVAAMGHALAAAFVLADAAAEGKKVIIGMLVVGLIIAAPPVLGETYNYFKYHRRGRAPH